MGCAKRRRVLFVQDESVDLRHMYLSVAALSGSADFEQLLHSAFNVSPEPSSTSGLQRETMMLSDP